MDYLKSVCDGWDFGRYGEKGQGLVYSYGGNRRWTDSRIGIWLHWRDLAGRGRSVCTRLVFRTVFM